MARIEKSIDVAVPVTTAYNQWTQFEQFPSFMEGVKQVKQMDDRRLHWVVDVGGQHKEWDAEITEQHPDERIAWKAIGDPDNAGVVTFHRLDATSTRVMMQMDYETDGMLEKAGDMLGVGGRRVQGDLERFKEMIESRGSETGAWRGNVGGGS